MRRIICVALASISLVSVCRSQKVHNDVDEIFYLKNDSVSLSGSFTTKASLIPLSIKFAGGSPKLSDGRILEKSDILSDAFRLQSNQSQPGTAVIPLWRNGNFVATGQISSYPGMMEIHSATAGFSQNVGKFTFYVGGEANKYGYFNGLNTQYGINGSITYRLSPKLTLTGYATFYNGTLPIMPNGLIMPPSMMGYFRTSTFGGTAEYQFNETFGLIVGGEAVREFGTDRYRFEPIVIPTFKIGKVKFGIPVGQILNEAIRSHIEERRKRPPLMKR